MATVEEHVQPLAQQPIEPLAVGDKRSREEFLRLWEAHPNIKRAELLGGTVYMPSPLSVDHGDTEFNTGGWLSAYSAHTPGTAGGHNTTSYILEETPQPDLNLRIRPEYGGGSWVEDSYLAGRPELLTEICGSSAAYDLHQKLEIYQAAKIPEYLAILVFEREIRWHILVDNVYQRMAPDPDKIWRSRVFPGLWLDGAALLAGDVVQVLAKLNEGLRSPEHQAFVEKLAKARKG
jgi:Uma2 family endonuclease